MNHLMSAFGATSGRVAIDVSRFPFRIRRVWAMTFGWTRKHLSKAVGPGSGAQKKTPSGSTEKLILHGTFNKQQQD